MFSSCLNNPVNYTDISGFRCVPSNALMDGGGKSISTDGSTESENLLEFLNFENADTSDFSNFRVHVKSLGRYEVEVSYDDVAIDTLLDLCLFMIPFSEKVEKAINVTMMIHDATVAATNKQVYKLNGYYDHYEVSISWDSQYTWDGGTTYTHHSYKYIYVWDTHTQPEKFWHLVGSENNTVSYVDSR